MLLYVDYFYCCYMLFISLLQVFTKNLESIGLIPPKLKRPGTEKKSAGVSIIFESLQKLCKGPYRPNAIQFLK